MLTYKYIKPGVSLFENQKRNVSLLVRRRKALLTDKVGSGKSLSVLFAFSLLKEKGKLTNMLVLTPLSAYAKEVWKKDIVKFTTLKCIDIEVLAKRIEGHFDKIDLLLNQYDVIYGKHSHVKQILPLIQLLCSQPGMLLVTDEVHALKTPNTSLTVAFKTASRLTKNFWGLTGTPLSKNLEDTYNIINLISPWYLGSFFEFRDTYCVVREKVIGKVGGRLRKVQEIVGIKNEAAFHAKIEPLVIVGESFMDVHYHYIDYKLSSEEVDLYRKIANGIDLMEDVSSEQWLQKILSDNTEIQPNYIKSVERYSSRFIYLQTASDGVLSRTGTQDKLDGTKINLLVNLVKSIVDKKQSVLIYFDFYSSLNVAYSRLKSEVNAVILQSTGEHVLSDTDITEAKVKQKPHVVLCTKAASESVSYYFINNCIFFHIPTVPHVFSQFLGRITRKNTKYPDDLNCYIFRSENIDLYKLLVVSAKAYQMEVTAGEDKNIPPDYKVMMRKTDMLDKMKKVLLWRK